MARALARAAGAGEPWPEDPPPPDLRHLGSPGRRPALRPAPGRHSRRLKPRPQPVAPGAFRGGGGPSGARFRGGMDLPWRHHGQPAPQAAAAPVASLAELAEWLLDADLFLGNNSGPMHLANAHRMPGRGRHRPVRRGLGPYWHRDRWIVLRHPGPLLCALRERLRPGALGLRQRRHPDGVPRILDAPKEVEAACRERLGTPPQPLHVNPTQRLGLFSRRPGVALGDCDRGATSRTSNYGLAVLPPWPRFGCWSSNARARLRPMRGCSAPRWSGTSWATADSRRCSPSDQMPLLPAEGPPCSWRFRPSPDQRPRSAANPVRQGFPESRRARLAAARRRPASLRHEPLRGHGAARLRDHLLCRRFFSSRQAYGSSQASDRLLRRP